MKKFITLSTFLLFCYCLFAQAPQSINYQGVARNAGGTPYSNQVISVRLTVRSGTPTGTAEYSEVRSATTNAFGLFVLQIGSAGAESITGSFAGINWNNGNKFLQTEIKLSGQPAYSDLGTTQMMSVPYAINSLQARQLNFPFDTTVNTNSYGKGALSIKNESTGGYEAIKGESINGYGLFGQSEKSSGVYGLSSSTNGSGVAGFNGADGGVGVTGIIPTSNLTGSGVYGRGINGIGVKGTSSTKSGVDGFSTNAAGVYGSSQNHHGVIGTTQEAGKAGVYGSAGFTASNQIGILGEAFGASTGVQARNSSSSGLALEVNGKIRITGNSQLPGAGKVLTSDADGNASWQSPAKVAFKVYGAFNGGVNNYNPSTWYKVFFATKEYDYGNTISVGGAGSNSVFTAPVSGLYHFDAAVLINKDGVEAGVALVKVSANGGENTITQMQYGEILEQHPHGLGGRPNHAVSGDVRLSQGDKVIVKVYWRNGYISESSYTSATSMSSLDNPKVTVFSGHLVFAD